MSGSGRVCSTYESPTEIHRSTSGRTSSPLPLLAAINETLTMGSNATRANLAFVMLLDLMGLDRESLPAPSMEDVHGIFDTLYPKAAGVSAPARTPTPDATP